MYEENERKTPYTSSLSNLITISENSLKKLAKKQTTIKIKSSIIMGTTLIATFTILRPIMYLALIGSGLINLVTAYKLKKQLYNISEHQKAITTIKRFLNLEIELNKKKIISVNTIEKFKHNMEYSTDLYECFLTNNMKMLKDKSKKYEKKINDNLITSNQISCEKDKHSKVQLTTQTKHKVSHNIPNYFSTYNKQQINGYQYTKK